MPFQIKFSRDPSLLKDLCHWYTTYFCRSFQAKQKAEKNGQAANGVANGHGDAQNGVKETKKTK